MLFHHFYPRYVLVPVPILGFASGLFPQGCPLKPSTPRACHLPHYQSPVPLHLLSPTVLSAVRMCSNQRRLSHRTERYELQNLRPAFRRSRFEFRLSSQRSSVGLLSMSLQKVACLQSGHDLALVRFSQFETYVFLGYYGGCTA